MAGFLEGGCLCGAIRYRIDLPALSTCICHCRTCRRAAGAQSVAWATVPAAGFAWRRGRPAVHASSPAVRRSHCPACGTSLAFQAAPATVDVTLASLDDPAALPPAAEIWVSHRLPWEPLDPALPHRAHGSDDA